MSDPGSTYRTRDEISSMRQQRDPVEHVRKLLTDNNLMEPSEMKKLEKVSLASRIHLPGHFVRVYCNKKEKPPCLRRSQPPFTSWASCKHQENPLS